MRNSAVKRLRVALPLSIVLGLGAAAPAASAAAERYVDSNGEAPAPPYYSWVTAARNIQDAIDVAEAGDEIIVTNGLYAAGGRLVQGGMNRVVIDKLVCVRSVNGPEVTRIEGAPSPGSTVFGLGEGAVRCVYIGEGALLSGFTLTNGYTRIGDNGGGALCAISGILTNCVVINNQAGDPENDSEGGGVFQGTLFVCRLVGNTSHGEGGGAARSTLYHCVVRDNNSGDGGGGVSASTCYNCLLSGNHSWSMGGGAFWGNLNNCTVVNNSANLGGGVYGGSLTNCIVYYNATETIGTNYTEGFGSLNFTCTFPLPAEGAGNIANEPGFVDRMVGDYHLGRDSACIDVGANLAAVIVRDLDDNFRPLEGNGDGLAAFDLGAYEYVRVPAAVDRVKFVRMGDHLILSWTAAPGLKLQRSVTLDGVSWADVPVSEGQSSVTLPLTGESGFFRLARP
jgi:hypothetical protein